MSSKQDDGKSVNKQTDSVVNNKTPSTEFFVKNGDKYDYYKKGNSVILIVKKTLKLSSPAVPLNMLKYMINYLIKLVLI